MSTRGLFIFKYKGKYYAFHNGHDSYPHGKWGLGSRLIENLKRLTHEEIINMLENLILLENEYLKKNGNKREEYNHDGETDFISIEDALTRPHCYWRFFIRDKETKKMIIKSLDVDHYNQDLYDMEYVYIMNIDEELFTIKSTYHEIQLHFPLYNIPDDWLDLYERVESAYAEY